MSEETKHRRGGRRPGRKPAKVDAKTRLERSRQSARECRARKKLRYQYLEELVANKEQAVYALRDELEQSKQWCIQLDAGIISQDLLEMIKKEEEQKENEVDISEKNSDAKQEDKKENVCMTSDSNSSKEDTHFKTPQGLTIEGRRWSQGSGGKQTNGSPQPGPSHLCAGFLKERDGNRLSRSDSDGSAIGIENIDFLDMLSDDDMSTCHSLSVEDLKNAAYNNTNLVISGASSDFKDCINNDLKISSQSASNTDSGMESSSQFVCNNDQEVMSDNCVTENLPYNVSEVVTCVHNVEPPLNIPLVVTNPSSTTAVQPATSDHIYAFTGNLPSIVSNLDDS